jgi:hypothetical protein
MMRWWVSLPLLYLVSVAHVADAVEQDVQQWSLLFANHHFDERWAGSFQIENRMRDDISEFDELILKPGGYYRFTDTVNFGVGYKYQVKNDTPNEQDLWQELFITPGVWKGISWTHQVRLEQRFVGGVDGTIPRLRYLLHGARPFASNPKRYLAFQNATRFNLSSNDKGPVDGFEQNRLYVGIGFEVNPKLKIEFGYLWRYQRERSTDDRSDHSIRLQFLFDTKGRHPSHGGT